MLRVVVLFGVPGAGKSYLAGKYCEQENCLNFDSDAFASVILSNDRSINDSFKSTVGLFCDFVRSNTSYSGTLIFTDSVSNLDNLNRLKELNQVSNVTLEFWKVDCPLQVAADRLKTRTSKHIDTNSISDLIIIDDFYKNNFDMEYKTIENKSDGEIDPVIHGI